MGNEKRMDDMDMELAIADLRARMKLVEDGVSNFRVFQKDARDFFIDHKAREQEKAKLDKHRARIHFSILAAVLALVVGIAIAIFQMWAQGHHISENSPQAQSHQQQNAGGADSNVHF